MNTKDEYARNNDAKASEESSTDNQFDLVLGAPEGEENLASNIESKKNMIEIQEDSLDLIDADAAKKKKNLRDLTIFLTVMITTLLFLFFLNM